jgi:putative protein kinase ArgK-like GTPase of G3E family
MKTTNEIQKQLERKSDDYLKVKAEEIVKIIKDIQEECNGRGMFYDYISDYKEWCDTAGHDDEKRGRLTRIVEWSGLKHKLHRELQINFKEKLVRKHTKELLSKLEIF